MSLLDLLTKEGRDERSLRKNIKLANDKYRQHEDRMRALEKLRDDGSDEALYGLLSRFSFVYDKTINDEAEKDFVYETLCAFEAERVLPPLRRYLKHADSIAWPLRVLEKLTDSGRLFEILGEVCAQNPPDYTRDPSKKIQLIHFCGDLPDKRLARTLLPYLEDRDEGVRFAVVDALLKLRDEPSSREPLLGALVRPEEESLRLQRRILEGLTDLGWKVQGYAPRVEALLPAGFWIDGTGKLNRKKVP